ncbi:hypothetical protein LUZ60_011938 [Juncus effusus]|nr:hypothetical protein LUZ60_011938 [Juncus effusus]
MVSIKKLVQMAKKWQTMTGLGRKRITTVKKASDIDTDNCSTTQIAEKRHFVIYSIDGKRFVVPLVYLSSRIIARLFKLSEEEFGFTVDGPITLLCDGVFMEYLVDLIKKGVSDSEELESALLNSLSLSCPYVSCSAQGSRYTELRRCGVLSEFMNMK